MGQQLFKRPNPNNVEEAELLTRTLAQTLADIRRRRTANEAAANTASQLMIAQPERFKKGSVVSINEYGGITQNKKMQESMALKRDSLNTNIPNISKQEIIDDGTNAYNAILGKALQEEAIRNQPIRNAQNGLLNKGENLEGQARQFQLLQGLLGKINLPSVPKEVLEKPISTKDPQEEQPPTTSGDNPDKTNSTGSAAGGNYSEHKGFKSSEGQGGSIEYSPGLKGTGFKLQAKVEPTISETSQVGAFHRDENPYNYDDLMAQAQMSKASDMGINSMGVNTTNMWEERAKNRLRDVMTYNEKMGKVGTFEVVKPGKVEVNLDTEAPVYDPKLKSTINERQSISVDNSGKFNSGAGGTKVATQDYGFKSFGGKAISINQNTVTGKFQGDNQPILVELSGLPFKDDKGNTGYTPLTYSQSLGTIEERIKATNKPYKVVIGTGGRREISIPGQGRIFWYEQTKEWVFQPKPGADVSFASMVAIQSATEGGKEYKETKKN